MFAYVTVALSAMQVGLGTQKLQDNHIFQQGSQRFAVASLILLAASVALIFIIWVFLFCFHFLWAMHSLKHR